MSPEADVTPVRRCRGCSRELPASDFTRHARSPDGLDARCRACKSAKRRDNYLANREHELAKAIKWNRANPDRHSANFARWYDENREEVAAKKRVWGQTENGRLCHRRAAARDRRLNPDKITARKVITSLVRAGIVRAQPCQTCGKVGTDAHHPDYARPRFIVWLCRRCHVRVHRGLLPCPEGRDV